MPTKPPSKKPKKRPLTWRERTELGRRFYRLNCNSVTDPSARCYRVWVGDLPADGSDPIIRDGRYARSARSMAWEYVPRTPKVKPGERVVPWCGNERCLDPKHFTLIPRPPKAVE